MRRAPTGKMLLPVFGTRKSITNYRLMTIHMTTNLGDEVDDAITSRCIAKLTYEDPPPEGQARIWRILSDLNKLKVSDLEIDKVVKKHPKLTGRDVKNLLKLASFVAASNGKVLDAKTIEYAMLFKPTETY